MKKSVIAVAVLSAISLPALAAAPAAEGPARTTGEVGLAISDITYKEPGVMREDGRMYGITGMVTYPVGTHQVRVDATWMTGSVDYKGSGTIDDVTDRLFEIRITAARAFESTGWRSAPYLGLGYRYLFDGLGGKTSSTGAAGYDRESNYLYVPIGADFSRHSPIFGGNWKFSVTVEYDYFWKGRQYSKLGAIAGYEDIYNDQDKGDGYRFSVRFSRTFAGGNTFNLEPYMKYWHIDDSKITRDSAGRSWLEPNNTSREWGIKASMGF